jgi:hypothetical protein
MRVPIIRSVCSKGIGRAQDQAEQAFGRLIQDRLVQFSGLDSSDDSGVVLSLAARHLQIDSGSQAGDPTIDGAPVADHDAAVAPLAPENVSQQAPVLAGIGAIQPVVGTHDGGGLSLSNRGFEPRQIDLPQRPLVDDCIDRHAARLLIVDRIVLERSADAFALNAADVGLGQLAGQIRVFGEIFKVPTTQRRAFDVRPGPKMTATCSARHSSASASPTR